MTNRPYSVVLGWTLDISERRVPRAGHVVPSVAAGGTQPVTFEEWLLYGDPDPETVAGVAAGHAKEAQRQPIRDCDSDRFLEEIHTIEISFGGNTVDTADLPPIEDSLEVVRLAALEVPRSVLSPDHTDTNTDGRPMCDRTPVRAIHRELGAVQMWMNFHFCGIRTAGASRSLLPRKTDYRYDPDRPFHPGTDAREKC